MHCNEFIYNSNDDGGATPGFIAGLLTSLIQFNGVAIGIGSVRNIFPPALKLFGMSPEPVIFIELHSKRKYYGQWEKRQIGNFISMPWAALHRRFGTQLLKHIDQAAGTEKEFIESIFAC